MQEDTWNVAEGAWRLALIRQLCELGRQKESSLLLDDKCLHMSPVVANCTMNRERRLSGSNGYSFELKFDIAAWVRTQLELRAAEWLDVCCGTGIALIEAIELLGHQSTRNRLLIEGVDLAGHFIRHNHSPNLELTKASFESWQPTTEYDLVTCVHGLHYIGDKLAMIKKMVNCLSANGQFLANLDLANFRFLDGRSAARTVVRRLRQNGIEYNKNHRLIRCTGQRNVQSFGLNYRGADDEAGPNYTGQPAVNSYYEP